MRVFFIVEVPPDGKSAVSPTKQLHEDPWEGAGVCAGPVLRPGRPDHYSAHCRLGGREREKLET